MIMPTEISMERPDSPDALALIEELECYLQARYPPSSLHGLSPDQLIKQNVAFFVCRLDGSPAACGGVKFHGKDCAEITRLFVRPHFRGKGLGWAMLRHLETYALEHRVRVIRLETGVFQPEALSLYERHGYVPIGPFAHFEDDPLSLFYEKSLQ